MFLKQAIILFILTTFCWVSSHSQVNCNNWLRTVGANSYVEVGDIDVSGNQITVECNFNANEPVSTLAGLGFLVDKHTMASDINYALWPEGCAITTSNNGYVEATQNCPVIRNKTYHVAMVYDGVSLKYYRNGFLQKQIPASGNLFQNNLTTCIARNPNGAPFNWTFNGNINEVRIWNVARSQADIRTYMYTSLPNPTSQTGLMAYYTFDNLQNKQGNSVFNGVLMGTSNINAINPQCNFIADSCEIVVPCAIKPDFTFTRSVCNPKEITFKNQTPNTSTFKWDFGNSTTNTTNQNPTVSYANSAGFWVQLVVTQTNGCKDSAGYFIDVNSTLDTNLIINKDTSICIGGAFKIFVKDPGIDYCWSASSGSVISNALSQPVAPTTNTIYYFNSKVAGTNLVINGDFESGNTGFTSDYIYQPPLRTASSQYYIGNNPNVWFNPFVACRDHTSNSGNMMMFDGSATANTAMWKQTIAIQPNTDYMFSGWVQSIVAQDPAQIILKINGNKVGATTKADFNACSWKQFSAIWNSGNNTIANLSILDSNIVIQGNDFAIDDILFAPIIIKTDSVKVTVNNCNVNPTCKGVLELKGHDNVTPPNPIKKYFPNTGFTWETWFNGNYFVNENTTIDTRCKIMAALDLPNCQDIVLGFGWPQVAQKNTLCFVADGPNGCTDRDNTPCTYYPSGGFLTNTWYHVAAVRDYANNSSKLYVNGVLVDSKTNAHGPINPTLLPGLPGFVFGSWTGVGNVDSAFPGKLDEIRIWGYPRTAAEIQASYDKCLAGNETGLVAYYRANEKSGTMLNDASVNGNNATVSTAFNWNKTLNAPIISGCLLATSSSKDTTICQGQTYWGHSTTNIYYDTLINSTGCDSVRKLNLTVISCTIAKASFNAPDTICINTPISIQNTSTGATTYNWSFCNANVNALPIANNLGNINGSFSRPVFIDYIQVGTNYYGFLVNHDGSLIRLDFGNSMLNIPTTVSLGNVGGIMNVGAGNEGIQVLKQNGKYFVFVVGGNPANGTTPKLMRFEFGTNITNTSPVSTDFGNIGNMLEPIDLYIFQDNGHYYGFTANAENNTLTRFDFTNDLTNTPTAINMGNIGGLLNYPTGINAINDNGFWRVFLANGGNSTLLRLDFGSSLLNTPSAINLGNLNNTIDQPRDLILESYCDGIVGFVVNGSSNTISRLNFSSFTSVPSSVNLGNIGNFNFPHSLAKLYRSGADVYSFVTNVNNNTITRIKFSGCNNASISNSSAQNPPSFSYNAAGTYNVNLTIDDGLATQSVFCKKIVVVSSKKDSINHTICQGQTYQGYAATGIYKDTFRFATGCDSIRILNLTVLPAALISKDTITSCGSILFNGNVYVTNTTVTTKISNYLGCDSIVQEHQIIINSYKKDSINKSICSAQSFLGYNTTGIYRDTFKIIGSCDSIRIINLVVDKYIKDSVNISICSGAQYGAYQSSGIYYDTIQSTSLCDTLRRINLTVKAKLNPTLIDDASICEKDSILLNPGIFYSYLWNTNATSKKLTVKSVGTYWVQVADSFGCKARDTFNLISINPLPKDFLPNSLSVCDGEQYTLSGYVSYNWMTGEITPTISLTTLPLYSVKVTDINGCSGSDSTKVNYVGSLNFQSINAFSPNGDGVNETFTPFSGSCITGYSMKIFDRWGQLLFETINPNLGWNGKFKGETLPMGVYYYIINYKNLLGVENRKSGSITLLR